MLLNETILYLVFVFNLNLSFKTKNKNKLNNLSYVQELIIQGVIYFSL